MLLLSRAKISRVPTYGPSRVLFEQQSWFEQAAGSVTLPPAVQPSGVDAQTQCEGVRTHRDASVETMCRNGLGAVVVAHRLAGRRVLSGCPP